jgi:hypothetical protein
MGHNVIAINRAPVLTLWAAVVAERLGHDHQSALSLGKAVAGLNAQSKGRRLGIYKPAEPSEVPPAKKPKPERIFPVELLGRLVPAKDFGEGLRAMEKDKPVRPEGVERYLEQKFGEALADVTKAMEALAKAFTPKELAARAFSLYARFRPSIPEGVQGWGAKGTLDPALIRSLAKK